MPVDNFLRTAYLASAVSDRQGKIYLEVDAYARPNATGTFVPLFELAKYDWMETPEVVEQRYQPLSYAEFGGIAYSGVSTGTYVPLMAEVPGSAPSYRGKVDRRQGLALLGQSQLNQLVGNFFTHENAQFPSIDVPFKGNYSNLDIAPQESIQVNLSASDTARGQAINGLYTPSNLVFTFNPENKVLLVRGSLNVITSGEAGTTIVIPEVVDDGGYGGRAGFKPPQINIPSLPVSTLNSFVRVNIPNQEKRGSIYPAFAELTSSVLYQSVGIASAFTSGTFSGNGVTVNFTGYYRVSFSGKIVNEGSNADIDTTGLGILKNGSLTSDLPILLAGSYLGNGNVSTNRGGYSTIAALSAGDELTTGITSFDGAESQILEVEGMLLLEYFGF